MLRRQTAASLVAATLMVGHAEVAAAIDLHRFWDQRCSDCHGHAGDFARRTLSVKDGRLLGRHHQDDLRLFLGNHGVPPGDVDATYGMLLAQASSAPEFMRRCGGCHGSAAALARSSLLVKDGVLYGRGSGQPITEFLAHHGGLTPADVPRFAELLKRLESEVHRP